MGAVEQVDGYGASLTILTKAAAFATAYPAVFYRNKYDYTVSGLIKEIVNY
jgi:hypothetical protein